MTERNEAARRSAAFYEEAARKIALHGRLVLGVIGEPTFAYTIGNSLVGLPELLMFGLHPDDMQSILNQLSELPGLATVKDGEIISLGGTFGLKAVRCGARAKAEYTIQATRYLETDDYVVVQFLAPDPRGVYPDEPGCMASYAKQPVMREAPH